MRLLLPYPGWIWVKSLETCVAVEVPSLKPVWYILVWSRCGASAATFAIIAFSRIFARCDLTTMGLMSFSSAWSLPLFFQSTLVEVLGYAHGLVEESEDLS